MKQISNNKIPFGLKNGRLVDVSEVESGVACGCVCVSCDRKLQANKGQIRAYFFSHDPSEDAVICKSPLETAIHSMAKQIISEEGTSIFPELHVRVSQTDAHGKNHEEKGLVEAESIKSFDAVEIEKRLDNIRPDIIAYQGDIPYLIEVAVTHFSDDEKKEKIRSKSIAAIEIDLSGVSQTITKEELKLLIIDNANNRKWLSHPEAIEVKRRLKEALKQKIRIINKGINQNHRSLSPRFESHAATSNKQSISFHPKPKNNKQYAIRWFVCENCKNLFKASQKKAPYTIETIPCPECDYAVSTK